MPTDGSRPRTRVAPAATANPSAGLAPHCRATPVATALPLRAAAANWDGLRETPMAKERKPSAGPNAAGRNQANVPGASRAVAAAATTAAGRASLARPRDA